MISLTAAELIGMWPELRRALDDATPVRAADAAAARTPSTAAAGRGSILVVDDDPDVCTVVVEELEDAGFHVHAALTPRDAFRLIEQHDDIDLMFTDIVMPGFDGFMLADMAVLRRKDIRVVYTSAYSDRARRQPGYRYGPMLAKPFRPSELVRTIARELAQPPGTRHAGPV